MAKDDELVLVIDRNRLFAGDEFTGVKYRDLEPFYRRLDSSHHWLRRGDAERDESVKQLIPYCIIRRGEEVFLTKRLATQTEARLHNLYSIGIGGHMNGSSDDTLDSLIQQNLLRELDEELIVDGIRSIELIGAINDDSTSVSRCHFGLLYQVWAEGNVAVRERDKMTGQFRPLTAMAPGSDIYLGMEDWSRHAVEAILNSR